MVLHELRFRSVSGLARAFERLVADPSVETCLADASTLTLRFRAAPDRLGALVDAALSGGTYRKDAASIQPR